MNDMQSNLSSEQRAYLLCPPRRSVPGEPDIWTAREAAKFALLGIIPHWFASFVPFTVPGGDKWVKLLDDGDPMCKRIEVNNSGDTPIEVEVTYKDEQEGGTPPPFHVPPHSSILIECHVGELRVRGTATGKGAWDTPSAPTWVMVRGSGPAYHHGPSINEMMGFVCKTFHISNTGKSPIKVKYTRLAPAPGGAVVPDEKKEEEVLPGNTLVIRCKIVSIDIEGSVDSETRVEEIE